MLLGIDLYPTPPDVIDQMLLDVEVADKVVLEPSAGFGNIVTVLKQRGARIRGWQLPKTRTYKPRR